MVVQVQRVLPDLVHSQPSVLVVDPDRVFAVLTTRLLEKLSYAVESVADAASALELLQQRKTDLVICEATLPDLPARSFIAMSQRVYEPSPLPVLVVSVELRPSERIDLLQAGALECLTKPVEGEELRFRVQRALRERPEASPYVGPVQLSGDLEAFSLVDVLTVLDLARHTGRVELSSNRDFGLIDLVNGRICHAAIGEIEGTAALADLLRIARGWFRVRRDEVSARRTIEGSTTQSVLEASVLDGHRRRTPSLRGRRLDELGVSTAQMTAPPPELAILARRLAPLLQDPHRLGELEVTPRDDSDNRSSLTLTWFGDSREAISALWELSAPLSPQILHDLRDPTATVRWRFQGRDRDQLIIRIVELDEPSPAWFHMASDLVVVAAPASGPLSVDPAIRAYVLTHRIPTLVLAQENEAARLFSPAPFTQISIAGYRLAAARGEARALLAGAVRMRASP